MHLHCKRDTPGMSVEVTPSKQWILWSQYAIVALIDTAISLLKAILVFTRPSFFIRNISIQPSMQDREEMR